MTIAVLLAMSAVGLTALLVAFAPSEEPEASRLDRLDGVGREQR